MPQDTRTTKPLPAVGPWINVGSAGAPAFENSWADAGAGFPVPSFRIDRRRNMVEIRGAVDSGVVSTTIWTMPVGFRPEDDTASDCVVAHSGSGGGEAGSVSITAGGEVSAEEPFGVTNPTVRFTGRYSLDLADR